MALILYFFWVCEDNSSFLSDKIVITDHFTYQDDMFIVKESGDVSNLLQARNYMVCFA